MKAIRTRFYGPTNTRGAIIIASDGDGNRVSVSYLYEGNADEAHRMAAEALCKKMNWPTNLVGGWYGNDCYWVFVL